jgi:large subunit ribosomal protein L9
MKVILRDDIPKLGKLGEVVEVRAGYARNYLLPRQLAFLCSPEGEQRIAAERKRRAVKEAKRREDLKAVAERLNGLSVKIAAKADEARLYGSIGPKEIAAAILAEHQVEIPESAVALETPIKELVTLDVAIKLTSEAQAMIKVWVVAEAD